VQPGRVHEGQPAQIQHDVAQAIGPRLEAFQRLGDLRDAGQVEFAVERDERRAPARARLNPEPRGGDLSAADVLGGFRGGHGELPSRSSEADTHWEEEQSARGVHPVSHTAAEWPAR
jgi:hypothetical protein